MFARLACARCRASGRGSKIEDKKENDKHKNKNAKILFCFFLIALIYSKRYSILFYSILYSIA